VVMPCQGNKLSGGGHSILYRVSHVRRYAPADRVLEGLETEVRQGRKGLWADPQPAGSCRWSEKKGADERSDSPLVAYILSPTKKGSPNAYATSLIDSENGWARCGIGRLMFLLGHQALRAL